MRSGQLYDVGAYTGTTSPYGAFDMGGDGWQWNESLVNGVYRGQRGGGLFELSSALLSTTRNYDSPGDSPINGDHGSFRVAMIPEPSALPAAA